MALREYRIRCHLGAPCFLPSMQEAKGAHEGVKGQKSRRLGWPWGACADDFGEVGDFQTARDGEACAEIVPEGDAELGAGLGLGRGRRRDSRGRRRCGFRR